ncbi:zinc finger protein ZFP2-like isoform X3 [Phymastichus coffea]|uniref:zinc finger protein ZFP2-like isoform X3 n=1 Tax=Phymastichus coffea TaxID=108790 RepID=UPI00273C0ECB|nr:zinc finger protein ZFP2-like isoform X3 [Phymastichus coffea]
MSGVFFLKNNVKMEQIQPEKIQVVVKSVPSNGIILQNTKGKSLNEEEIKTTEYFLEVEEQDSDGDIHQAQYVTIENQCEDSQDVDSQFVPLEIDDNGQIILEDKDVILWDELCRICANTSDKVVPIFFGEGLKHNLCKKIENYLPFSVSEEDTLPLQVCYNCAATLLAWHEMTQNCLSAQQRLIELQNKLNLKNQVQNSVSVGEDEEIIDNGTEMETTSNQDDQVEDEKKIELEDVPIINESETDRSSIVRSSTGSFKDFRKRCKPSTQTNVHQNTSVLTQATSNRSSSRVSKIKANAVLNEQVSEDDLSEVKKEEKSDNDDDFEIEIKEEIEDESSTTKSPSCTKRPRRKQKLASPKNHECKQCGKAFRQRKSYEIHMRQHTGEKPFTCHICGKQFGQTGSLYYHLKHLHGGVKNHACDICGRCFAMKTAMEDHRRIHTGERPYICDVCGKTFKTKASLYIHSKIHTDEYPFNCSYCKKPFRWKQQMISHLTTHTGEKNHVCEICNKGFGVKNELTRHRRTHSTDKPFSCQKCGLSFGQKRYLTNHSRTRHKIKPASTT